MLGTQKKPGELYSSFFLIPGQTILIFPNLSAQHTEAALDIVARFNRFDGQQSVQQLLAWFTQ